MLQGIKNGADFRVRDDKSGIVDVYDKDGEGIITIDLNDAETAERQLLNRFEEDAASIIKPEKKIPKAAIVKDLTNPIKNVDSDISEEDFMDNLSGGYLKRLSKLGIGLEETNVGNDALLLTKPNGDEVEIDLEEDGWQDVYSKEMESAIKMSPEYEGFVNEEKNPPKKQETITDVDKIKKLDLSSVSKDKKVEGKSSDSNISSFYDKLRQSESSSDTTISRVNKDGRSFVGELQFGEARLNDYKKDAGVSFTLDDFNKNPSLQEKVAFWHIKDIDKYINKLGDSSKGYNLNGLRAIAHLGGKGGMKKWLETKGEYNPSDELGTSLSDYYNKFSK